MSINWVMLTADGKDIVPLTNETTFYRKEGVRFELDCSNGGYPGAGSSYNSKSGTLLLTNQRVIYLCGTPNSYFASASLPINNIQESKLVQPWFSAASFKSIVMPVPGGGLTQPGRLTIAFPDSTLHEFDSQYRSLKERLQELDGQAPQHLEQLPVYDPPTEPPTATSSAVPPPSASLTTSAPLPQPQAIPYSTTLTSGTRVPTSSSSNPSLQQPATSPAPPAPGPTPSANAIPSDLPPSYDEIR